MLILFIVCHAVLSVPCSLVPTCWERADLCSPVCDDFLCFFTFPYCVLGWVSYLIISIPDLGFFLTIIIVALFLIKSLKRSGETYCLNSVSSYYYSTSSISSFSFHQNFVWMSLSNYWMDCSEIWGYGRYGCEVVQEGFKMSGSTAGP